MTQGGGAPPHPRSPWKEVQCRNFCKLAKKRGGRRRIKVKEACMMNEHLLVRMRHLGFVIYEDNERYGLLVVYAQTEKVFKFGRQHNGGLILFKLIFVLY